MYCRRTALLATGVVLAAVAGGRSAAQSSIPPDLVLHAADATAMAGTWQRVSDAGAASGTRIWQPDAGAPKITSPASSPRDYFDLAFQAEAGRAYRLWLRGTAQRNSYNNDSVYVQFSGSVDANGAPIYRIGTTSGTPVVIEDCSGCGVSGWGWQDNEYGGTALGPAIYFAATGRQTLRIQAREDGISIDQIVLSSATWFTSRPGALKNDTTILPKTLFSSDTTTGRQAAFQTAPNVAGDQYDVAAVADINGDGRPDVVGLYDNEPVAFSSFLNNGDRTFTGVQYTESWGGPSGALAVAVDDFTSDGRKDVLFLDGSSNGLILGAGDGTGRFTFGAGGVGFSEKVTDFAVADFDRDGKPDVVTIEPERNAAVIYAGTGAGTFAFVSFGSTASTPTLVKAGDVDGDGRVDALVLSRSSETLSIMYGDGTGRFRARGDLPAVGAPRALAIGDLNRDGRVDIVIGNGGGVLVYLAASGGGWAPSRQFATTRTFTGFVAPGNLDIGDINGDGIQDLVVGHQHGRAAIGFWDSASVLYGDGSGAFGAPDEFEMFGAAPPPGLRLADFDADSHVDIFAPRRASVMWNTAYAGNHSPVADAGPDTTITTSQESPFYLWSHSTDADGHLLTYAWSDSTGQQISEGPLVYPFRDVPQPAGTYTFTLAVDDMHGGTSSDTVTVTVNSDATGVNHPPVAQANVSLNGVWPYEAQFQDEPDPSTYVWSTSTDPDGDPLGYEWRDENGTLLGTGSWVDHAHLIPGTHTVTLTVRDGRGGESSASVTMAVKPFEEIVIGSGYKEYVVGPPWQEVGLPDGTVVVANPDAGAAKVSAPLAAPASYVDFSFPADPTQEYKLWIRLKAQNDYWGNDSVWVQFTGATDASGNPVFRTGTSSGLAVNLEECAGCGLSGWGWRDDAWGTAGTMSTIVLRFPQGGVQTVRIQTREDGATVDQIVLSARKYKTTRPGAVKNDTTRLPFTAAWGS